MTNDLLIPVLIVFIVGAMAARVAGLMARQWLASNAGWQASFGDRALRYIFGIFMDIGPIRQYTALKRARQEPPTLATVFWVGFAGTVLGLVGLIFVVVTVAG